MIKCKYLDGGDLSYLSQYRVNATVWLHLHIVWKKLHTLLHVSGREAKHCHFSQISNCVCEVSSNKDEKIQTHLKWKWHDISQEISVFEMICYYEDQQDNPLTRRCSLSQFHLLLSNIATLLSAPNAITLQCCFIIYYCFSMWKVIETFTESLA